MDTEFVFVVDASPDNSYELLAAFISVPHFNPSCSTCSQLWVFRSSPTGLHAAKGDYCAVIAGPSRARATYQILEKLVHGLLDIVVCVRRGAIIHKGHAYRISSGILSPALLFRNPAGASMAWLHRRIRDELLTLEWKQTASPLLTSALRL